MCIIRIQILYYRMIYICKFIRTIKEISNLKILFFFYIAHTIKFEKKPQYLVCSTLCTHKPFQLYIFAKSLKYKIKSIVLNITQCCMVVGEVRKSIYSNAHTLFFDTDKSSKNITVFIYYKSIQHGSTLSANTRFFGVIFVRLRSI